MLPPIVERAPIRRNVMQMFTAQVITWLIATVLAVVIPRALGPEVLGELSLATSLWLIAAIVIGLGTSMYLQLEIAQSPNTGLAMVGPVIVLRTAAWLLAALVLGTYTLLAGSSTMFALLMALVGFNVLINVWSDVLTTSFLGMERMSIPSFLSIASKATNLVLVLAMLALQFGVYGVVIAGIIAGAWPFLFLLRRFTGLGHITLKGANRHVSHILRSSWPFMMAGLAVVVYQQIDVIAISWMIGPRDVGWYSTADSLVTSLGAPATVVFAAIFPALGRLHRHDPEGLVRLVQRAFSLLTLAAVPIGLGTMVIAPSFAPMLYGDEFRETGDVLVAFGPVIILSFCTLLFGGVALATERSNLWVAVVLGAAALTIPLDAVLVPWTSDRFGNGAIGGAIAFIITETFQFAIGLWRVAPHLVNRATAWRIGRILIAGGAMMACTWPLREQFILLPIGVGAITYGVAVVALRVVGADERALIVDALRRG